MSEKKKEEAEIRNDRNYDVLAQIYTILNDEMSQKGIAMRKVLQKDFDVNYSVPSSKCSLPNIVGRTALDFALEKRELEIFKMLISHGADFTSKNNNGSTILHRIIENSHVKSKECYKLKGKLEHPFVDAVLSAHVESKNVTNPINEDGISHFHIACMFNHVEAVQFFLNQGVSVNEAISQDSKIFPGSTLLHLAARYSAFETAKLLLEYDADVNLRDAQGLYPLFLLIQRNNEILDMQNVQKKLLCEKLNDELLINENMIKLLLKKNDEVGLSRCHVACTLRDTQKLEEILAEGVDLKYSVFENSSLWPGHSALHFAALFNIDAVRLLVANGADIMTKDSNGITPFDLCLHRYSPHVIHSVMTVVPELNNIVFCNTQTKVADLILAMSEHSTLESFLQETNRNVNMNLPCNSPVWPGHTVLHIAIALSDRIQDNRDLYDDTDYEHVQKRYGYHERKCYQIIELCLGMGADINLIDFSNSTPLSLAFHLQNRHIVNLIMEYDHKLVNVADSVNLTHLHIACAAGQSDLVKKFLLTGIDVNQHIKSSFIYQLSVHEEDTANFLYINPGWTCLHIAVATSKIQLAELLIKYDADLYAKDSFGMTPIHQVLCTGYRVSGYNMLSRKYYENRVTSFGLSHLHVACFVGDLDAVAQLLRRGAKMEGTINYNLISSNRALSALAPFDGYTPVHFALRERNFEIVKLLVQHGVNLLAKSVDGMIPFYEMLKTSSADDDSDARESNSCAYCEQDSDPSEHEIGLNLLNMKKIEEIVKEDSGITRLHVACSEVNRELAIKLLKRGADPNAQIHKDSPVWPGFTPLHNLMTPRFIDEDEECIENFRHGTYQDIKAIGMSLLKHGASIALKNVKGNTPIHEALEFIWSEPRLLKNNCHFFDWSLKGFKDFSVNPVDSRGISHFDVACMSAQVEVAEHFLEHGVDVNRQFGHFSNHYGGFSPLHLAVLWEDKSVAGLLVKHGAKHLAKDFLGNTPLHTATLSAIDPYYSYSNAIYETLFKAGANVEAKNLWDETPLRVLLRMCESADDYEPVVENTLLVKHTCRVNVFNLKTEEGILGIILIESRNNPVENILVYQAIVKNPSLNDIDEMGRTVIHNVVSVQKKRYRYAQRDRIEDYTRIIYGFMQLDFDIDYQDYKGQTALHKAVLFGNYDAIVGLLINGADINVVDASNKPAVFYSIDHEEQDEEILKAFLLHVYKLNIAGLEISSANQDIVDRINKESGLLESCNSKMQRCSEELENLKNHVISNSYSITLYNFLSEPMLYFRMILFLRDDIDKTFVTDICKLRKTYPHFAGLLQMQYRNIFIRAQLIDPAKSALNFLAGFLLPDLCSERILKSLYNRDLKQLIASAQ